MTDQIHIDARQAGSDTPPLGVYDRCTGCPHALHGQGCEQCRDNPEPDPNLEIQRLIKWLIGSLGEIGSHDRQRIVEGRPLDDERFIKGASPAAANLSDDCERLITLLSPADDAEQIAGELGVEHTLNQGESHV